MVDRQCNLVKQTVPSVDLQILIRVPNTLTTQTNGCLASKMHPLQSGDIVSSPGCHFSYRIIGPCCRIFDREQLPWPCCRLQWRSKEPSWRRIGRRLVVDLATQNSPSYSVEILGQGPSAEPLVQTFYWIKLPRPVRDWWVTDKPNRSYACTIHPPSAKVVEAICSKTSGGADDTSMAG